ncbi:MAG: aminoacyl-tRNA hydrolase [Planctomycetes bacterium]|nr:aminoacyl-tRNA hydrolase [Planctomycetota bacterium]
MKLIVGLGNPGPEYSDTRHNVGFVVLDRLARRWAPGEVARARFHAATLDARMESDEGDVRVLLLKPTTFMNRSGLAISEAVRFYKLDPADALLVIVDDVALPCGTIRVRPSGGAGGHNGLDDIRQKLGTDQYARLRIGIDGPGTIPQKDYVLGKFRPDQRDALAPALEEATEAATHWAARGCTDAMNRFNRRQSA